MVGFFLVSLQSQNRVPKTKTPIYRPSAEKHVGRTKNPRFLGA